MVFDVQLGGMSGIELAKTLAAAGTPPTPVIYITAHDDPETRASAEASGCAAYYPQERVRRRGARDDPQADRIARHEPMARALSSALRRICAQAAATCRAAPSFFDAVGALHAREAVPLATVGDARQHLAAGGVGELGQERHLAGR